MEEEKIQKLARMLEKGGKMLAAHCACNAPLFKYHNEIICAACGRQYEKKGDEYILKTPAVEATAPAVKGDMSSVELAIIEKLNQIASDLKNERDPRRIQEQFQCIELGVKILQSLRKT
ncbi:MAG: Sjogren's syndrome/scleroderma autoantigen 1 family protein [Methanocellales archaeon]